MKWFDILLAACLAAVIDVIIAYCIGIGGKEYKQLIRFAKKNKKVGNYKDIFETLLKEKDELNGRVSRLEKKGGGLSLSELEDIRKQVSKNRADIEKLIKKLSENNDQQLKISDLMELYGRLERNQQVLEAENKELKSRCNEQEKLIKKLSEDRTVYESLLRGTESDSEAFAEPEKREAAVTAEPEADTEPTEVGAGVAITKDYLKALTDELKELSSLISVNDCKKLDELLNNLLAEDDYDEEEAAEELHSAIEKRVYKYFKKVRRDDRDKLRKFLTLAGYKRVDVPCGEPIQSYIRYFDTIHADKTDDEALFKTIKSVDIEPYCIRFVGCDEDYTLPGSCEYYEGR